MLTHPHLDLIIIQVENSVTSRPHCFFSLPCYLGFTSTKLGTYSAWLFLIKKPPFLSHIPHIYWNYFNLIEVFNLYIHKVLYSSNLLVSYLNSTLLCIQNASIIFTIPALAICRSSTSSHLISRPSSSSNKNKPSDHFT